MRDVLGPGTILGYCTNVHAGATLAAVEANLTTHAVAVREHLGLTEPLGIGLWLAAPVAVELRDGARLRRFADWLAERQLDVFTINGFPYGDFHEPVVKHRVYEPNWTRPERLDYTLDLMHVLAALRPEGAEGSISTLPLGWPIAIEDDAAANTAAAALRTFVAEAARLESETGRRIHLDLEPEPGCRLERSADVVAFFTDHLLAGVTNPSRILRHVRVCHDVCHAAVMFEEQADALAAYAEHGIGIGKVQLSSALRVAFDELAPAGRAEALQTLRSFAEDRYLHQTTRRTVPGYAPDFEEDLPHALTALGDDDPEGEWRVHFHVPLFAENLASLATTQGDVRRCLELLRGRGVRHFEVETYAWNVLPPAWRPDDLASGIARELEWVRSQMPTTA